ncbi:alpha/beta hydrolase [Mangrovimicrobium sediminis]|uniref:Alpha/beta hydrolase n=1 Tax=Mangrovimicrobium sediminis TaxID=2562682 RepID=A0A4Z0LYG5_9GAMM|nr:alpha/beta hydrolase [Haliea sp. SAOS-164]TGD72280.1 alpha/beta hydrolase [Haliea sp. SAOS-164]
MATFVLVHGGGHGGWCYQPVARLLRASGHEVYTPTLTGLGEREHLLNPSINLDTHITDVVKLLQFEDLQDVYLVGHSYGGMVITGVADRAPERIGNLVYLDAAFPSNGQSLVDVAGEMMAASRARGRIVDGVELVLFPDDLPYGYFGVTDPAQIEWMAARLTPHPFACFEQKLVLQDEARVRALPQSFIVCAENMPEEYHDALREMCQGRFWVVDTGHDLMITEAEKVAGIFEELASM